MIDVSHDPALLARLNFCLDRGGTQWWGRGSKQMYPLTAELWQNHEQSEHRLAVVVEDIVELVGRVNSASLETV
jgi:hypothetical protein